MATLVRVYQVNSQDGVCIGTAKNGEQLNGLLRQVKGEGFLEGMIFGQYAEVQAPVLTLRQAVVRLYDEATLVE
jgi:hypothetical protein